MGSRPAVPPPKGRIAETTAARTPRIATALASIPPSVNWASTTASSSGTTITKSQGASVECATASDSGEAMSGHPKAMMPTLVVARIAMNDRLPIAIAGVT